MSITFRAFAFLFVLMAGLIPGLPGGTVKAAETETLFSCSFDTEEDFNNFSIINVHDDATWTYASQATQIMYSSTNPKDDWLVTPALELKAGVNYTLNYNMYGKAFMGRNESFEIGIGSAPSAEALSAQILKENGVVKYTKYDTANAESIPFTVEADGTYYIGFHATTPAGEWTLVLDDVIVEGEKQAAEMVNLFTCGFDTESDFDQFSVIDVAGDSKTWIYSTFSGNGIAQISFGSNAKDDYLVLPAIAMQAGGSYQLSFKFLRSSFIDEEKMEVCIATTATADALSDGKLIEEWTITERSFTEKTVDFSVPANGNYYIAFHATSDAMKGMIRLDDILVKGTVSAAEPEAPAAVADLTITPAADLSLKAQIECTLPSLTEKGNKLSAIESAEIFRGETLLKKYIDPSPGASVLYLDTDAVRGENTYSVRITANGLTSEASATAFVGKEFVTRPAPVTDFLLVPALNGVLAAQIQFKTPSKAADGSELKELDRIDITRNGQVVHSITEGFGLTGTTLAWLDTESVSGEVTYGAIAVNEGGSSDEVTDVIILGIQQHDVPYSETFDKIASLSQFTIIDANSDGKTWDYSISKQSAGCNPHSDNVKDDWIITPPLALKKNFLYKFSYKVAAQAMIFPERFETFMGPEATIAGMTMELQPATDVKSSAMQEYAHEIKVDADGNYYFGIHAISDANAWYLLLDDINVEVLGTDKAPGAVTGAALTPAADGALTAVVSFTTPSVSVAGTTLNGSLAVDVYLNGEKLTSFENLTAGTSVSKEIEVSEAGVAAISLRTRNSEGYGLSTDLSAFIGVDVPVEPTDVVAAENIDGTITVTWNAPAEGANGGKFAEGMLTYDLYEGYTQSLVKEGITGTSFTYAPEIPEGMTQAFAGYIVVANTSAGSSDAKTAISGVLAVGQAYPLPYKESFTDGGLDHITWNQIPVNGRNAKWRLLDEGVDPDVEARDGDGGLMSFFPFTPGDKALTYGGKVDVSKAEKPVLSFYYYHIDAPSAAFVLDVQLSERNGEFKSVKTILMNAPENSGNSGWRRVLIPLDAYKAAGNIRYQFVAEAPNAEWRLHVDEITVFDAAGTDTPEVRVSAPTTITVGEKAEAMIHVLNYGEDSQARSLVLTHLRSGDVAVEVPALKSGEGYTAKVDITPDVTSDKSIVLCVTDSKGTILSEPVEIEVMMPLYPAPEQLTAEVTDNVALLTWEAPASTVVAPQPITDDVESYTPLIIENVGDWTMFDIDGALGTWGISNNLDQGIVEYEHAEDPMAFQVFNPSVAGVALFMTDASRTTWTPFSGSQYFAAFSDKDDQNNDWLISPELNGCEQTISFYVSSITSQYNLEKFRVLYTTGDINLSDFEEVKTSISDADGSNYAPVGWTFVTATLPEGARYFAINNVSDNSFCFLVDDITYIPATSQERSLELLGYNVYVGATKVNAEPVKDTNYTLPLNATHIAGTQCSVTAVYDLGESGESNRAEIEYISGLSSAGTESVLISGGAGQITVKGIAASTELAVYGTDGRVIALRTVETDTVIPAACGIYVVKVGAKVAKVVVR